MNGVHPWRHHSKPSVHGIQNVKDEQSISKRLSECRPLWMPRKQRHFFFPLSTENLFVRPPPTPVQNLNVLWHQISDIGKNVLWHQILYWEWEEDTWPKFMKKILWWCRSSSSRGTVDETLAVTPDETFKQERFACMLPNSYMQAKIYFISCQILNQFLWGERFYYMRLTIFIT